MSNIREIVTKAVVGKGKQTIQSQVIVAPVDAATKVLGCWIINHHYGAFVVDDHVEIRGTFDVHVWHAHHGDHETSVVKRIVDYVEEIPMKMKPGEVLHETTELKTICSKYPTCTSLEIIADGQVKVGVAKEFIVDAIGETKLRIQVTQLIDEDWAIDSEIDSSVNPQYMAK